MKRNKGFTLIELLVVIAIIGILSSIVLASLNTARSRGANAAVKSNLANVRVQAEIWYDTNSNTYGTFGLAACPTTAGSSHIFQDNTILRAIQAATTAGGGANRCVAAGSTWAATVALKAVEGSNNSWCVDSTGISKAVSLTTAGVLASGSACP